MVGLLGHAPLRVYLKNICYKNLFGCAIHTSWYEWDGNVSSVDVSGARYVYVSGDVNMGFDWAGCCRGLVYALDGTGKGGGGRMPVRVPLEWRKVVHASVGGVTTGIYWIGYGADVILRDREEKIIGCARLLRHVMQPATRLQPGDWQLTRLPGDMSARSDHWDFTGDGLLPVTRARGRILTPSVFTKSRWVVRTLSWSELCDCFDVPMMIRGLLDSGGLSEEQRSLVLVGCPAKVLVQGLSWMSDHSRDEDVALIAKHADLVPPVEAGLPICGLGSGVMGNDLVAVKHDDAVTPFHLWNDRLEHLLYGSDRVGGERVPDRFGTILEFVRLRLCCNWRRRLLLSLRRFLSLKYGGGWIDACRRGELGMDLDAGRDCIQRASMATWWDWNDGSRLFFWRWHPAYQRTARDGVTMWIQSPLPSWRHAQPPPKDPTLAEAIQSKLMKVRHRRYVAPGSVKSLTSYFAVPKGTDDVRMVYNASSSGLNDAIWVPNFALPSVDSVLRGVESTTWMCDNDIGDMFLNFMLHVDIREYAGIDLSPYFGSELSSTRRVVWERWERCMMGLKSSPYQTIQSFLWAEEFMRGEPSASCNILRWDVVRLNLPGSVAYRSDLPWVCKFDSVGNRIACDFFVYVDDVRPTGGSELDCWVTARRVASVGNYLGIQDASRKRRPPSQHPGAWAGALIQASEDGVGVLVSLERWKKTQAIIASIREELTKAQGLLHKPLERARGFLVYIARTYPMITPYLKGIHLTLETWRGGRNHDGWVGDGGVDWDLWDVEDYLDASGADSAPLRVRAAGRLDKDIQALQVLVATELPPVRMVRSRRLSVVRYGFGDASGAGFGSSVLGSDSDVLWYRHGVWGVDEAHCSSNYRELRNLVDTLYRFAETRVLSGTEMFMFTDNSVAEAAYYNGTSSNEALFLLVLRLRRLEMESGLRLHVIHVSGKRMMSQGTDGLSRGNLTDGILGGSNMLDFVPLHLSAIDRHPALLDWVRSWCGDENLLPLMPEDWFRRGHDILGMTRNVDGVLMPELGVAMTHLWTPAPAAADVALEELRYARHKRQQSTHIFLCPRLMTNRWRRALHKVADVVLTIEARWEYWPSSMYEPLIFGVCLPFGLDRPWIMQKDPEVVALGGELQRLWKAEDRDARPLLRQLLTHPSNRCSL